MGELPVFLRSVDDGCRISVRVHPKARRERIAGIHGTRLKIEVAAPPTGGAANRAVEMLLATILGVPARDLAVIVGLSTRDKVVAVRGLTADCVAGMLANRTVRKRSEPSV